MKYLKKYKIFESIDSIAEDLEDIFLELKDDGNDIQINKYSSRYSSDIGITFIPNKNNKKAEIFFNSEELKRAYSYLQSNGYTAYYLTIIGTDGDLLVCKPSSYFDDPTIWKLDFGGDFYLDYQVKKIEVEFHKPLANKWYVIWESGHDENDEYEWDNVGGPMSREEANELVVRVRDQNRGEPGRFSLISDLGYWNKQR